MLGESLGQTRVKDSKELTMIPFVALLVWSFLGSVSSQRILWSGSAREITIPLDGTGPHVTGIPIGPQMSGLPLAPQISVPVEVRSQPWLRKRTSFPVSQSFPVQYPKFPLRYPKEFTKAFLPKHQIQTSQQPIRVHYPQMHGYKHLQEQMKPFDPKPYYGTPLSDWKTSVGGNVFVVPSSSNKVYTDPVILAGYLRAVKSGDLWKPNYFPGQTITNNLQIPGGGVVLAGDGSDATVAGPTGSYSIDGGDVDRVSLV
ncbi:uncharacterized protein [Haliotis asinina]|uniref:uncharacterized protein isoform X2 n=1 Tax=Haliotis asinina TaxID=109174 RepID=UPI0035323D66